MIDSLNSISTSEWLNFAVLVVSLLAFIISILAYKRAGEVLQSDDSSNQSSGKRVAKHILGKYKNSDVAIMITAKRNAQNELRLIIQNSGIVTAKDIDIIVGEPIRVIKKEELANGITDSIVLKDPAIKPRLTVIDASIIFPITELLPGVEIDILAITTMGFGKICDFPVSISWYDDRGTRHFQDDTVTI